MCVVSGSSSQADMTQQGTDRKAEAGLMREGVSDCLVRGGERARKQP